MIIQVIIQNCLKVLDLFQWKLAGCVVQLTRFLEKERFLEMKTRKSDMIDDRTILNMIFK